MRLFNQYCHHIVAFGAALLTGLLCGLLLDSGSHLKALVVELPVIAAGGWLLARIDRLEKELDSALAGQRLAWAQADRAGYALHQRNQEIARCEAAIIGIPAPRLKAIRDAVTQSYISGHRVSIDTLEKDINDWFIKYEAASVKAVTHDEIQAAFLGWSVVRMINGQTWEITEEVYASRVKA